MCRAYCVAIENLLNTELVSSTHNMTKLIVGRLQSDQPPISHHLFGRALINTMSG